MATATLAPAGPILADPGQPASSPAQDHVRRLHASGGTYSGIAAAAGLAPTTVRDLASGRRPATPYTTTAVLAVTTAAPPRTPVDAGGTRLRLRALHVMGHGSARIARAVGAHPQDHPRPGPRRRHHHQPEAARRDHRRLRRLVGQARPRTHPLRARRGHRRPQTRHRRELVRRRRPGRRPARHPRLPAPAGLDTRHRHRHRPRHLPARPPPPEEPFMTSDYRITSGFIHDILDVWSVTATSAATTSTPARAIGLIGDVARIYEGTQDHPAGARLVAVPSSLPTPRRTARPGPPADAVILTGPDVSTVFAALDIAADYKRDRAAACADCADQTCLTCQSRLPDARRLRPVGRPDDPGRGLGRPAARARPRCARQRRAARGRRPGGRTVTWHRTAPAPCTTGQTRRVTP